MVPNPPLIIPEIGRGEENKISATIAAYRKAAEKAAGMKPETIVISSPHSVMYSDYFHISPGKTAQGSFRRFRAGQIRLSAEYDEEFVSSLSGLCDRMDFPAGTMGEKDAELDHASMIPLYFINQYYSGFRIVRVGLSGLSLADHYRFGMCIKETAEKLGRRTIFIGSGDLSHRLKEDGPYGFAKEGPEYDRKIMSVMSSGDFEGLFDFSDDFCERAGECGHRSFTIMAGALDRTALKTESLSYEGPFGVGYGVCAYEAEGSDPERNYLERYEMRDAEKIRDSSKKEDDYVSLARKAVEAYVKERKKIAVPRQLPEEMRKKRAGTFVSIHEDGRLRGCIGTISAVTGCIAQEIIENAISASSRDPRFSPIRPDELPHLAISVDVLGDTEEISSQDELDVRRYGVIVSRGMRGGLLLPNLSGVDTPEEQIAIAKRKAGIPDDEEQVKLERFEVERHGDAG